METSAARRIHGSPQHAGRHPRPPVHEYRDPQTNFGFGRTFLAIDVGRKKVLWSHREEDYVDARGVCLAAGRIYFYIPEKQLGCLDTATGEVRWRNSDAELLAAIGPNGPAQHYITGYATTTYLKVHNEYLFFAGPQRSRLVVARTGDGKLLWQKEHDNLQLVLRDDGIYAAGPQTGGSGGELETGFKFAYETGEVLAKLPMRRACTRATGSVDSIFYRAAEGTVRFATATNHTHHLAPMRPPCQDGVIISSGNLYWGPWMCGCQLSLYGQWYNDTSGTTSEKVDHGVSLQGELYLRGNELRFPGRRRPRGGPLRAGHRQVSQPAHRPA